MSFLGLADIPLEQAGEFLILRSAMRRPGLSPILLEQPCVLCLLRPATCLLCLLQVLLE